MRDVGKPKYSTNATLMTFTFHHKMPCFATGLSMWWPQQLEGMAFLVYTLTRAHCASKMSVADDFEHEHKHHIRRSRHIRRHTTYNIIKVESNTHLTNMHGSNPKNVLHTKAPSQQNLICYCCSVAADTKSVTIGWDYEIVTDQQSITLAFQPVALQHTVCPSGE